MQTKWVWVLLSTVWYDIVWPQGGNHINVLSQRGRKKRKDTDAEREGRIIKNRQKQNFSASASCLCQFCKGPATRIIYWEMILDYESALSVKSEKICRVRYFKLKNKIFLLKKPPKQHKTQQIVRCKYFNLPFGEKRDNLQRAQCIHWEQMKNTRFRLLGSVSKLMLKVKTTQLFHELAYLIFFSFSFIHGL